MCSSIVQTFGCAPNEEVINGGWYPYSAKNGDIMEEVWKGVLYHHPASGSHCTHLSCLFEVKNDLN